MDSFLFHFFLFNIRFQKYGNTTTGIFKTIILNFKLCLVHIFTLKIKNTKLSNTYAHTHSHTSASIQSKRGKVFYILHTIKSHKYLWIYIAANTHTYIYMYSRWMAEWMVGWLDGYLNGWFSVDRWRTALWRVFSNTRMVRIMATYPPMHMILTRL